MKKLAFALIFIGTNLFFIFFHVYKNSKLTEFSFNKQRYEKERTKLQNKKELLTQQLQYLQNRSTIKQFAQNELGMEKIKLSTIKTIPHE